VHNADLVPSPLIAAQLSPEAMKVLVAEYRNLRTQDIGTGSGAAGKSAYRITVRQLESMVRLSEALARLHLAPTVRGLCVVIVHGV